MRVPLVRGVGWLLQLLALVIVGTALLIGLFYGKVRTEVMLLAVGGAIFLIGRTLNRG